MGTILNIVMIVAQTWPTYLFFVIMGIGLIFILLGIIKTPINMVIQLSMIAIPFIVAIYLTKKNSPSKDIFLIPEGYIGKVTINYDQKDGTPIEFEDEWRIYRIPSDGVLNSQFQLKNGRIDLTTAKYFYLTQRNDRTLLNEFCGYCDEPDSTSIQVIYGSLGIGGKGAFQDFFVNSPASHFNK
ncbi:MAG: hypothetical protein JXR10_17935 [Cyclobacteriaceae bacterium]